MFARYTSAVIGACLLATSPALAQSEPLSVTVSAADLDLGTKAGRAQLDRRLRNAAGQVCDTGVGGLSGRADYRLCYKGALATASREADTLAARTDRTIQLARNTRQ